jgi:methyl-accepting chemotaxis protein
MLESQTEARHGYHAAVLESLSNLVSKLEGTVSELPPTFNRHKTQDDEDSQSGEDPSELFHRDIGTQTSPESFLMSSTSTQEPDPFVIQTQTSTLRKITFSLDSLRDNLETHASAVQQTKARVELLKDDVREMDRRARDLKASTNNAGYSLYSGWSSGGGTSGEPDDEIRRAREMLRGMKGAVLSRAMGPTSRSVGR